MTKAVKFKIHIPFTLESVSHSRNFSSRSTLQILTHTLNDGRTLTDKAIHCSTVCNSKILETSLSIVRYIYCATIQKRTRKFFACIFLEGKL